MSAGREKIHAIADEHAARDWRNRKRWQCACVACAQAKAEHYEPKSTREVLKAPAQRAA